ncbi:MAG: T9SS type A sorting domain-containing protein [Patescibacteria group bacterium]
MKNILLISLSLVVLTNTTLAQTYKYDNNHQLTEIKYDNGFTIAIQYDANGNRTLYAVTAGGALPLTLLSFNAQKSGEQVSLTWTTTDEVNTDKFEVEHSKGGVIFSSFGTVPARGNTTGRTDYSTLHCCPVEGVNYYRLKMIDRDGSFKYSAVRKVVFEFLNEMNVYPNPSSDKEALNVSFIRAFTHDAFISVFTSTGSQIFSGIIAKGVRNFQINTERFSPGTYFVIVRVNGAEYKKEFIKQ